MGGEVGSAWIPRARRDKGPVILLDTHVVLWMVGDSPRLGPAARRVISDDRERRVSAMVAWEIAMLADKKGFTFHKPLAMWLADSFRHIEAQEVAVSGTIAIDAGSMRGGIHGDPCDRIMIATARTLNCPLITADEKILDYAMKGHLAAIDARR
jgi:PIN domain nuclease of toxin-antitoxin system